MPHSAGTGALPVSRPPGKRRSAQKKAAAIEHCETKKQARITLTEPHQPMKHRDKEGATQVTFCTIRRPLRSLLDLHGEPLPKEENPVGLAMRIAPWFAFLPVPVLFDIQGEDLLIRYPEEPTRLNNQLKNPVHSPEECPRIGTNAHEWRQKHGKAQARRRKRQDSCGFVRIRGQ